MAGRLSETDKNFVQATLDMVWPRDRVAMVKAYRASHPAAAELTDKQVGNRINAMPGDAVDDARAEARELAAGVRRDGVRKHAQAVFTNQELLLSIERGTLEGVEELVYAPIGEGMSAGTKVKALELGHKVASSARPGGALSPALLKAAADKKKALEAERASLAAKSAAAAANDGSGEAPSARPALFVGREDSDGRA